MRKKKLASDQILNFFAANPSDFVKFYRECAKNATDKYIKKYKLKINL